MIILIKLFILFFVWSSFYYASVIWLMIAGMGRANPLKMYGIPLAFLMFGLGLTKFIYNYENRIVLYLIFLLLLVSVIVNAIIERKKKREREKRWLLRKPTFEKKLKELEERLKKGDKSASLKNEIRALKSALERMSELEKNYINNLN